MDEFSANTVQLHIEKVFSAGMQAAIYDPQGIMGDAFSADNHTDGVVKVVMTAVERAKLAGIESGAQVNTVTSVAGKIGAVALVKSDVGLSNVDNTSDANKPVSSATQTALNLKANDNAVVHNTGAETVAGIKTFSSAPVVPSNSFPESAVTNLVTDLAAKATDTTVVHLAGTETITGAKTFSTAPTVPSNSFPESAVTNLVTDLAGKQPLITAGTTSQYYRGDKTFQTLDKAAVGLGNVDNTSDINKPVSTAQQAAIDLASANNLALIVALG